MSDGVAITAGSGTTIATDDCGAPGHAQIAKLAISTDGSATLIPADAANGIDVDVTRLPALVAGSANIGDVDVLTVPADPFGVNADASSATGSISAKLRAAATALELIDDTVYTDDTSTHATGTSKGLLLMAAATPTDASVNANDIGAVGMTTDRKLHVSVQDSLPAGTAAIGKLAANSGVDIGDVDVTSVPADPFGANADAASATGSISAKLRFIAATGIPITSVPSHAVTIDAGAVTSLALIDDPVFADEAAFTLATSKVNAVGGYAVAHGSAPDATAAGTVGIPLLNRHRVQFVIGGHPNVVTYGMSLTTAVSNTVIGPTIGAGAKFVVTGLAAVLDNASTVFPTIVIGFGTANTPAMATTPGTAGILLAHPACPAGGGISRGDGSGIVGVGADNEEVRITTTGNAGGAGIYVTLTGYTIET